MKACPSSACSSIQNGLTGVQWDSRTPDFKPFFERFIALVRAGEKAPVGRERHEMDDRF